MCCVHVLCVGFRLKQQSTLDSDRVKSLEVDLQRRDEETADLREKLADSKRQIQQVHKEVQPPPPPAPWSLMGSVSSSLLSGGFMVRFIIHPSRRSEDVA